MPIRRRYFPLAAAATLLECEPNDLIHAGANGELDIYALAPGWRVDLYYREEVGDTPRLLPSADGKPREVYGEVRLLTETLRRYESDPKAVGARLKLPSCAR